MCVTRIKCEVNAGCFLHSFFKNNYLPFCYVSNLHTAIYETINLAVIYVLFSSRC